MLRFAIIVGLFGSFFFVFLSVGMGWIIQRPIDFEFHKRLGIFAFGLFFMLGLICYNGN